MTSAIPLQIIEDDDNNNGFDWEAAVREIDVACLQNPNPSTNNVSSYLDPPLVNNSNKHNSDNFSSFGSKRNKKHATCKQSTLHSFIRKMGLRNMQPRNNQQQHDHVGVIEGDERVSFVEIDAEAAKTWIYPVNVPLRDYQLAITRTALFSNTLVALPTGLGKTLIAAVVMYNYFRWFPDGKIVFAAPSRPLVMQQIEACHNIVGIPQEWTIDMTGQVSPTRRACFWKTKRVFFVTPQVLEKDIQAGTCLVRYLVCLVIDEAHRALGNYSYCVAVRELMAISVQLRILALTATPGSKQQAVQNIIDNLQISTLEYRNENDPDVSPYVHNRKIELIEVALGKDAVDINKLLLEVIHPYIARLSAIGLLQNRDFRTLSPPDLLNSRDKFRQAPPPGLPQNRYGEIEAYFGGLITLYHIRKLLSSHGIRPAYEMLEEKLKQGSFARLMSKNEEIRKIKLLMQQSLSHGAPSPKLSKMLEVLVDHFKTKDPQSSRVIIFSNFRGSVRDITDALASIGNLVKATEFIGQSSGKVLKGQSQKVQQAVLQKFRTGGYNVIVATSIGEEGLDIMEVDLVICFDANVSPLRMIQRMGRTGRKHDGRVVVLACEGSELKGYMRKQANSRAISKHMYNGGINSFNFHSSPRMIPHIFKPEIQFVELSIEQYVPRGKKVKDDGTIQTSVFKDKLTVAETALIAKYFQPGKTWTPSLIAFPRFQAFPSRVDKVMHSFKTNMLIDSMQRLQALSFSRDSGVSVEEEVSSGKGLGVDPILKEDNNKEDPLICYSPTSTGSPEKVPDAETSPGISTFGTNTKHGLLDFPQQSPHSHSYLFGSDYVSVDGFGNVLIMSVPLLPLKEVSHSKHTDGSTAMPLNCLKQNSCCLKTLGQDDEELIMQCKAAMDLTASSKMQLMTNGAMEVTRSSNTNTQVEKTLDQIETIPESPNLDRNPSKEGNCVDDAHLLVVEASSPQADEYINNFKDTELSPRLTNMIRSGVVPESPVNEKGLLDYNGRSEFLVPDLVSTTKLCELLLKSPSPQKNGTTVDSCASQRNFPSSPTNNGIQTPLLKVNTIDRAVGFASVSPVAEVTNTPLANLTKNSSSKDWVLSFEDKSENVEPVRKYKRLRKVGVVEQKWNPKGMKENLLVPIANLHGSFSGASRKQVEHLKGKKKRVDKAFIEEEAEVSSDAEVSDDEDDEPGNSSYDDSFIDDRINPTAASTQAEGGRVDMMTVYRRSLLSQSPMDRESSSYANITPDSGASTSRMNKSGSSSVKTSHSLQTPQTDSSNHSAGKVSESFQVTERTSAAVPFTTSGPPRENETKLEDRKRKLSFCPLGPIPVINLEREFSSQAQVPEKEPFHQGLPDKVDPNDDQFFASLDLDAVEAQATLLLKHGSEVTIQKPDAVPPSNLQIFDLENSPSFDLGI